MEVRKSADNVVSAKLLEEKDPKENPVQSELTLPEKLCRFYVERPKLAFGITLSIQLSTAFVTAILYLIGYDILPYDFGQVPLNLEKDPTKLRADAFNFANQDARINLLPTAMLGQPERSIRQTPIELVFKVKYGNILNKKNLADIKKTETELYNNKIFKKICHLNSITRNCSRPLSIIRLFDGTYAQLNRELYDPEFNNIKRVMQVANNISATRAILAFSLDVEAKITGNTVKAMCIRSLIFNGFPLKGYKHADDRKVEQENEMKKLVQEAFADQLAEKYESGVGDMDMYYNSLPLFFDAIDKQVIYDLLLAAGSFAFIFCFIWINTGSLWITSWALLGILTNFFGANLVYRVLLDFQYIGIFHVLSVFIILGIGADDVFVFFNTWKLMEQRKFPNLTIHLTETYRCAASAMFVTSLTTMAAFLASAASPLLAVSSFGVFSGILVLVNYVSICIFFPSVVVTYHYFWQDCKANCKEPEQQNLQPNTQEESPLDSNRLSRLIKIKPIGELFKSLVCWFEGPFVDYVILHPVVRWVVLVGFTCVSIVFVSFAVQLRPEEKQVQVWKPGTNWHDIRQIRTNHFKESGEGSNVIRVYMIWGLGLQDRRKCHFTDYKCKGETVLDEEFDMNAPGCQISMLNFCKKLKSLSNKEAEKLKIRRSIATGELEVSCFMEKLQTFLRTDSKRVKYPLGTNLSLPIDEARGKAVMKANPFVYNESMVTEDYKRFFEVGLGYWLSDGGSQKPGYQYIVYGNWMGGSLDPTAQPSQSDQRAQLVAMAQGGKYGNRLRYAAVVVNTSLTGATLRYKEGNEVYGNWEKFIDKQTANMPQECKKAFQCTPEWNNWHWLKVQWVLLIGAVQGIIVGLSLAIPVLVFTTCNWIIGLLAALTISLITNAVVGLIPMLGWKLGVMESLNLTLVVGLAVDYCVHLADGYVRSKKTKRVDRIRDMLRGVGVSVLSGACTTLGASSFMLGSKILFFFQFGMFMFCTIGFSILFALCFFTVVVGLIGPEGDSGSLKNIVMCLMPRRSEEEATHSFSAAQIFDLTPGCSKKGLSYNVKMNEVVSPTLVREDSNTSA